MGAQTLAGEQRVPPPTVAAPQAQLPLEQGREGVWRGGRHTLRHLHVVHTNHGDGEEMNCDQLYLPGAPNVVAESHSRVAEGTRLSPEGVYSGVS